MNDDDRIDVKLLRSAKEERGISDERYAVKLVERIVFWGVAAAAGAVVLALIASVVK